MNFALVFLIGICALEAHASPSSHLNNELNNLSSDELGIHARDGFLENIRKFIEAIIKQIQETFEDIIGKAEKIIVNIIGNIQKAIEESQQAVDKVIRKVLDKIEKLAKESEVAQKCVELNRPVLEAAISDYFSNIKKCSNYAIQQAQNIQNDIQPHIDAIQDNVDALQNTVNKCLEGTTNPLLVIQCIAKQANHIRDQMLGVIENAKNTVSEAATRSIEIVHDGQNCISSAYLELYQKAKSTVNVIEKCILDVSPETKWLL